jgi:Tfp pilus assembly protein PilO
MAERDLNKSTRVLGLGLHAAGLGVVLLIAAAGCVCLLRPVRLQIEGCETQAGRLEARLNSADKRRAEQQELTRQSAALAQEATALARRVPDEALEAEFLSQVAAAASQVGLKILDYRPAVASAQEDCSQMEIQLSCSGPYGSLCRFLERLTAFERLSRVTDAEIAAAAPDGCAVNMTLVIFFQLKRPAETPAPLAQPGGLARG